MNKVITFSHSGYDDFIGFLKAYCIIGVVLAHCLPATVRNVIHFSFWGDMQVPLFLLIQVFHAYKKGVRPSVDAKKILRRIVYPFLFIQIIIIGALLILSHEPIIVLKEALIGGGKGPGTYYFWIFLQFALLLPFFWPVFNRFSMKLLMPCFIILCLLLDIICSIIHLPEPIYRLLAIRYVFLIYLGMMWVKGGIKVNLSFIILSLLSLVAAIYFRQTPHNLEPFFFTTAWRYHRWPCFFYVYCLLPFLLWEMFQIVKRNKWLTKTLDTIGQSSYEIFLFQMLVFVFLPNVALRLVPDSMIRNAIFIPVELLLSIVGGIYFREGYNKIQNLIFRKDSIK